MMAHYKKNEQGNRRQDSKLCQAYLIIIGLINICN